MSNLLQEPNSERIGAGDSHLLLNFVEEPMNAVIMLNKVVSEVNWMIMKHKGGEVPRLVAIQGTIYENNYYPVYRHPADNQPALKSWTESVYDIKCKIERHFGLEMNHCLIQYYRSGKDYISEHSDKTLDIGKGSIIANYTVGASRTLILKLKNASSYKHVQKLTLCHNSLFVLGLTTNREFTHAIKQDKRSSTLKRSDELICDGQRISFTFRSIATYRIINTPILFGQGAKRKQLRDVIVSLLEVCGGTNGDNGEESLKQINGIVESTSEALRLWRNCSDIMMKNCSGAEEFEKMVIAFSHENKSSEFDWESVYGEGFDFIIPELEILPLHEK